MDPFKGWLEAPRICDIGAGRREVSLKLSNKDPPIPLYYLEPEAPGSHWVVSLN